MKKNKLIQKAKDTFSQAADYVKEKAIELANPPATSIAKLEEYISTHPETKITTKTWLGTTFSFYRLEDKQASYYMEKRDSYLLQLDVTNRNGELLAYRSYKNRPDLHTSIPSISQIIHFKNNKKAGSFAQ
ncbi:MULTISPECIES: hypothetical protein [Bacillaceae]|uniref:hypothetical protein n=1 Tax=Bacillaceae TaxID=186817 RepID=UPI000E7616FE|nr:hypothetical protein [Bacillus sp. PK3_68]RJS61893.1 hypothetical protein CJ483_19125 [Bacillus sp. PK3_68]